MKQKNIKNMYQDSGYHNEFIGLFLLIIITVIIEMISIPYITKKMLNDHIPDGNIEVLILFGVIYIIIMISQCYMILKHCEMRCVLQRKIQRDLREKIFKKLQEIQIKFYDDNTTGTILQFLQDDVQQAGQLFPKVITEMVFMGLIRFAIIAIFLMIIDVKITCMIVMLYIIGFVVTLFFNRKTIKEIHKIRQINIEIYTYINEGIKGFLTIKTLNIIQKKEEELKTKLQNYFKINEKLEKIITLYNSIFTFLTSFSTVIIIYYGGINIMQGIALYAEIMLLMDYSGSLKHEFNWFIRHITNFHKSVVSYSKILQFINLDNIEDIEKGITLENIHSIEFKDVSFSYDNEKNIQNFSLKVREKESVALIGKTGSGKTTITNLLCRFYEPKQGQILINGKNYKEYNIRSLRNKIGYVLQEIQIVPNTIIDNIKYVNPNITLEEIEDIFKRLKLHDKIQTLKDAYYSNIYDNQDLLSTGEKQLINFARIMAINPDVIILDEVTSTLSYKAELLVKNAIDEITKGKIVFIIAHRLSTIEKCDCIVVMQDGKIVEVRRNVDGVFRINK